MGKLSILGAQRVKALTEMIEEREKQVIAELKTHMPKYEELKKQVNEEFGIEEKAKRVNELEFELRNLLSEMQEVTGEKKEVRIQLQYSNTGNTAWSKRYIELQNEQQKAIQSVQREFADKKRKLWLCETLEEAKELVGI